MRPVRSSSRGAPSMSPISILMTKARCGSSRVDGKRSRRSSASVTPARAARGYPGSVSRRWHAMRFRKRPARNAARSRPFTEPPIPPPSPRRGLISVIPIPGSAVRRASPSNGSPSRRGGRKRSPPGLISPASPPALRSPARARTRIGPRWRRVRQVYP